jgi:preprotein translocase subunit SecD
MRPTIRVLSGLVLAVVLLAGCGPRERVQVLLETDLPKGECVTQDQMTAIQQVLQQRLRYLRIGGVRVQQEGEGCAGRILVDWPASENPESVARTLRSPGLFEFVEIGPSIDSQFPEVEAGVYVRTTNSPGIPDRAALGRTSFPYPDTVFKAVLTGSRLKTAKVDLDSYGAPAINFQLDDEGSRLFAGYTASHIGDILAIVLDNVVLAAPRIHSAIPEGQGEITGQFTREEAEAITAQIGSGLLPAPLRVLEMYTTSAPD